MANNLSVIFWGVRGAIPSPGNSTQKYGGNCACIEMRVGQENRLIIIDAGTGIRKLGNHVMKTDMPKGSLSLDLFLSHTHWDHIMGFPFFLPIYEPHTQMKVHGPVSLGEDALDQVIGGLMKYRYFPISVEELSAHISYHHLGETSNIDMGGGLMVSTKVLNHSITTLGYKFEFNGKIVCTCFDHEPFRNLSITDKKHPEYDALVAAEGEHVAREQNDAIEEFFHGADLLIHDAQYTEEEYHASRVKWGHSSMEHAVGAATRAGVKKVVFFHHDPDRTDTDIENLEKIYCVGGGDRAEVVFAQEGMIIDL